MSEDLDYIDSKKIYSLIKSYNKETHKYVHISKACQQIDSCYDILYTKGQYKHGATKTPMCLIGKMKKLKGKGQILKRSIIYFKISYDKTHGLVVYDGGLSELLIGSIISKYYSDKYKYCINFGYYKGFFFCPTREKNTYKSYVIMEEITNNLKENPITSFKCMRNFLLQTIITTLCALKLGINHNDFHGGNVMYKIINDSDKYKGKQISKYTHFKYIFNKKVYYIQNNGVLFKYMDLDFASKFGNPGIIRNDIMQQGYCRDYSICNEYSPSYDLLIIIDTFHHIGDQIKIPQLKKLCLSILKHYTGKRNFKQIKNYQQRPRSEYLDINMSDIIDKFFFPYSEKPCDAKILQVCNF